MGIFRDITKSLKKAAPIIGAGIGMYYGGAFGASLGSGIGSLASGKSAEESLKNAVLAGGTAYLAGGSGFGKGGDFSGTSPLKSIFAGADTAVDAGAGQIAGTGGSGGILSMIQNNPKTALALGGAGIAALSGLGDEEMPKGISDRPFAVGQTRLGYGRIGDTLYNLDDKEELEKYKKDNRERSTGTVYSASGGEVNGPGTGTSDSVPARLSDGEFVVTAQAVRGAGGGDRDVGAARMYDMMSQLEGAA